MKAIQLFFLILSFICLVTSAVFREQLVWSADGVADGRNPLFWNHHSVVEATIESRDLHRKPLPVITIRLHTVVCGKIKMQPDELAEMPISYGTSFNLLDVPDAGERVVMLVHNERFVPFHMRCAFMPKAIPIVPHRQLEKKELEQLKITVRELAAAAARGQSEKLEPAEALPSAKDDAGDVDFETFFRKMKRSAVPVPVVAGPKYSPSPPASLNCASNKDVDQVLATFEPADKVEHLFLAFSDVSTTGLRHLRRFAKLRQLGLEQTSVDDAGLQAIVDCTDLTVLDLSETKITAKGVRLLATERRLQRLSLSQTQFTDEGLPGLKGLPELYQLMFFRCGLSDAVIDTLVTLPNLKQLYLGERNVSGAGIDRLAACRKLELLSLQESGITDEALRGVVAIHSLKTLVLIKTAITDKGLEILLEHPNLEVVFLNDTRVTAAGVQRYLHSKSLKRLNLTNTEIKHDDVEKLKRVRPSVEIQATFPPSTEKKLP